MATLINQGYTYIQTAGSFLCPLFADVSSTFNALQPLLYGQNNGKVDVNHRLTLWVLDISGGKVQSVRSRNYGNTHHFFFAQISMHGGVTGYSHLTSVVHCAY